MITTIGDLDRRLRQKEMEEKLKRMGKKYLVMSGKGGVGKTSICSSLALAKAQKGASVGLMDVDFHGPNIPAALFLEGRIQVDSEGRLVPMKARENLHVLSIQNLLTLPDEAVLWRGPRKLRAILQFIGEAAWPELDYFFIDSPPGTGDEALTCAKYISDLKAILVTTGQALSLVDAAKAYSFLLATGTSTIGLVDSMGDLICPHCKKEIIIHDKALVEALAQKLKLPILARVPWDLEAAGLSESLSKPIFEAAPSSVFTQKILELAEKL
ncbi:MAG: Mrp/NBP35 family ATP-binding protein [Deltaproteobacteria bacterium]|jgi:Mrp family chromosome partitioning ATPase|nr:Mrp/NBP35 family ATP-binding protein [Deltaproteobacteria bacterium]